MEWGLILVAAPLAVALVSLALVVAPLTPECLQVRLRLLLACGCDNTAGARYVEWSMRL